MLNLDEFAKSIKTHQITINGKEYTAKPLTMKELMSIQKLYNDAGEDELGPVHALFTAVGYPADELLELPVQAIIEVQRELFLSIQEQLPKDTQKKGKKA